MLEHGFYMASRNLVIMGTVTTLVCKPLAKVNKIT